MRLTTRARKLVWVSALLVALAASAAANWRGKPPAQWTQEEALEVLNDSPWARTVELYQPSGRRLGVYRTGEIVVVQDSPTTPERFYQPPPSRTELEIVRAVYAVRWSSAATVQQALERLRELSNALADAQAPPAELSPEHYVLTVRVVEPPTESAMERLARPPVRDPHGRVAEQSSPSVPDLFVGLSAEELRDSATLQLARNVRLKPERALRHGLGAGEGISFFFPRTTDGKATLASKTDSVEFQFRSAHGITLKAKFKPAEMQAGGKPDY